MTPTTVPLVVWHGDESVSISVDLESHPRDERSTPSVVRVTVDGDVANLHFHGTGSRTSTYTSLSVEDLRELHAGIGALLDAHDGDGAHGEGDAA